MRVEDAEAVGSECADAVFFERVFELFLFVFVSCFGESCGNDNDVFGFASEIL